MKALDDRQRRAAELYGRGLAVQDVAASVGVSDRTVRAWKHRPGFLELARESQAKSADPTALDVCRAALHAKRRDGSPDWQARLTAARLLLTTPASATEETASNAAPTVRIYGDAAV